MKTVFFGPFVGEFGWEYLYWHAWVNKVCASEFKDYKKIVSSYPGRESFYLHADEYWPHPEETLSILKSCNGYITDYWFNGFPRPNTSINKKFMGLIPYESWEYIEQDENQISNKDELNKLLSKYKDILPKDTIFYTPYEDCHFNDFNFGVKQNNNVISDIDITQTPIPFSKQSFQLLKPTKIACELIKDYLEPDDKIIAIYPRNRAQRRLDKNWTKENYLELISYFKINFPEYKLGIFGAPGQAFFDNDMPGDLVDFINLPDNQRMNIQIAALQQADLAVGSLSGAVLVSRAVGVPTLSWGLARDGSRFHDENRNEIETIFHPIQNPEPEDIQILSSSILNKINDYSIGYRLWNSINFLKSGNGNTQSVTSKMFALFKSKFYAKNKDYE